MPKFTKDDVNGWIAKCEKFFKIDRTHEDNKVVMALTTLYPVLLVKKKDGR